MNPELGIFLVVIAIYAVAAVSVVYSTVRTGSPPMPSNGPLRRTLVALSADAPMLDGPVFEIGSGWGGLARLLAEEHHDRKIIGFEVSPIPYLFSRFWKAVFGPPNLQFRFRSPNARDLGAAGAVVIYLSGDTLSALWPMLRRSLRPGTPVISAVFALDGLTAERADRAADVYRSPVFLYRLPEKSLNGGC